MSPEKIARVVSDASPLVILARIGLLSLLEKLFGEVHVPQAVYDEVVPSEPEEEERPGSREVAQARSQGWLRVHPTPPPEELRRYRRPGLSRADASVIALAVRQRADVVLADERALRRALQARGFRVVGVGGLLLRAKERGLLPSVREPLERARREGLRIHPALVERILREAGELPEPESESESERGSASH